MIQRYEKNEILGRPRVGATEQLPIPRELRRPRSHRTVGELFVYVLLVFILCLLCVRNLCSSFFIPFFSFHFGKGRGYPWWDEKRAGHIFYSLSLSIILTTAACSPPSLNTTIKQANSRVKIRKTLARLKPMWWKSSARRRTCTRRRRLDLWRIRTRERRWFI